MAQPKVSVVDFGFLTMIFPFFLTVFGLVTSFKKYSSSKIHSQSFDLWIELTQNPPQRTSINDVYKDLPNL